MAREICGECKYNKYSTTEKEFYCSNTDSDNYGIPIMYDDSCDDFEEKNPISNPMSFWTEQDVLLYTKENDIPLASVYGDIVVDYFAMNQCDNQMSLSDYGVSEKETPVLKTTGCERTGCMFCGYGCHLEKSPNRFERMKKTHPKIYDYIMRSTSDGGLGYKEIIEWINANGNMNIKF